jgi:hypothetical protein
MFNSKRAPLLYWAFGIAGAVVAAAGAGTWLFIRGRNRHDAATHAKRVIARATKTRKPTAAHAKTNHSGTHHAHAR